MNRLLILLLISSSAACLDDNARNQSTVDRQRLLPDSLRTVADIPVPAGYTRLELDTNSFGVWLRNISLKKDNRVYLFDGSPKRRQSAQFAVLDISVGNKDLQQCADAVMRLRAEYLFSQKRYREIQFTDNANQSYRWDGGANYAEFGKYLERVFGMCGSASLEKQLKPVNTIINIEPGYVLIRGGFPGHAMLVVDVAINKEGKKVYMLAQSYMPAQDIHIVRNPGFDRLTPWYQVNEDAEIVTPEWTFTSGQLRKW